MSNEIQRRDAKGTATKKMVLHSLRLEHTDEATTENHDSSMSKSQVLMDEVKAENKSPDLEDPRTMPPQAPKAYTRSKDSNTSHLT